MAIPNGSGPNERNVRLDDFLRLEAHHADSDLNIDEHKNNETGLHDIHLQDSRSFSDTLHKLIDGIPETWLSLVSQTTRLANVMETFRVVQTSSENTILDAWKTLERRSDLLENMICSFDFRRMQHAGPHVFDSSTSHQPMLRALNAALVIFFYRRVRRAHATILAGNVDNVIAALADFETTVPQDHPMGPASAWPCFIAGCEALTPSRREAFMRWLDRAESACRLPAFETARKIMTEVWDQQDEHLQKNRGDHAHVD